MSIQKKNEVLKGVAAAADEVEIVLENGKETTICKQRWFGLWQGPGMLQTMTGTPSGFLDRKSYSIGMKARC